MGVLKVKRHSLDEISLVFPGGQVRIVIVLHNLQRCTIARFGLASFGVMTRITLGYYIPSSFVGAELENNS
jgi:hypothetical protein